MACRANQLGGIVNASRETLGEGKVKMRVRVLTDLFFNAAAAPLLMLCAWLDMHPIWNKLQPISILIGRWTIRT
jgi:hypothetical protein